MSIASAVELLVRRHGDGLRTALEQVAVVRRVRALAAAKAGVDAAQIARAGAVGRLPVLAGSQRKPGRAGPAATQRHAPAVAAAAHEGDQGRRIDRARCRRPRHPGPARTDLCPAAVVRGGKAPRGVVHPGPAPGFDPAPAAVAVGRPVGHADAGVPDAAVGRIPRPFAVAVEQLVAGHVAREVACRERLVFQGVAPGHPLVETVARQHRAGLRHRQAAAGKNQLLAGADLGGLAVGAVHRGRAVQDRQARGVGARIDVQAVLARLLGHQGQLRGVDFDPFPGAQLAHAQRQRAFGQGELGGVVVQFGHRQLGRPTQAQGEASGVQFGARAGLDAKAAAGGHRPVQRRRRPAAGPGAGQKGGALLGAEVGHAAGRIGLLGRVLGLGQQRRAGQQRAGEAVAPEREKA